MCGSMRHKKRTWEKMHSLINAKEDAGWFFTQNVWTTVKQIQLNHCIVNFGLIGKSKSKSLSRLLWTFLNSIFQVIVESCGIEGRMRFLIGRSWVRISHNAKYTKYITENTNSYSKAVLLNLFSYAAPFLGYETIWWHP